MTTRRRRAGSSEFDDPQYPPSSPEAQQNTSSAAVNLGHLPKVAGVSNLNWNNSNKAQDAYYKKTDDQSVNNQYHRPTVYNPNYQPQTSYNQPQAAFNQPQAAYNQPQNYYNPQGNNNQTSQPIDQLHQVDYYSQVFSAEEFETSTMACRDRSTEFAGIIRSQQQGHMNNGVAGARNSSKVSKDISQYSMFMNRSRMVGRNISSTYAKLEKLTFLARKRSLFDDSQDTEVQELTSIIRHDLTSLTQQLEEIRKSSQSSPSSTNHMQKHSANLVGSLQSKVANITSKFRDVLEVRTENLKKQAKRREQFTGASGALVPQSAMNGVGMNGPGPAHTASVLLADEAKATALARRDNTRTGNGDVVLNFDGVTPSGGAIGGGGAYQQQLHLMEEQDSLLNARAETMKTIECTIVELGTMFSQLATMVKEQDELVYRIDSNVDDAELNVDAAHTELLKYFKNISSNRWLMLKVFGVVIFFFIIFIVFMA